MQKAHAHRDDPDDEGHLSGDPRNPADREKDEGGTPAATQNAPCQLSVRIISLGEFWPSERAKVGADPVLEGCGKSVIA
ncbi:hypothetical protein QWZ10_22085 [Paracoccus cavernae]|uniref:Uncharacterized protein n=1 Tax=Paracoccus cavernae TaxID=1571207 RepID=A0ABT8DBC4_9RHOB|nr:hypothetical protein [Paracoccus cavernae]